jgi:hypothetical protein
MQGILNRIEEFKVSPEVFPEFQFLESSLGFHLAAIQNFMKTALVY